MRILPLTGALALVLAAAPGALSAQDSMWTAEQAADMASWPDSQQASFKTWPMDYQMYYWTLTPTQRTGYWRLTNEQRAQLAALTPEQRLAAWTSIEAQMAGMADTTASVGTTVATTTPGTMDTPQVTTVVTTTGNMTPPPAEAMNKAYPICSRTVTDSCQNPGEGGAPGRSRALKYWPGKPASEGGR
ncbi:MAG TPA: hypothetical protein VM055_00215 [Novosphingobium sp.]|nr:hypothetical protein [Novosphingobium sp.]